MGTALSIPPESGSQADHPPMAIVRTIQTVHCPTCGSPAERSLRRDRQTSSGEYSIQTACPSCDYLMVISSLTSRVIEAYAPGQMSA